jgi:hypothetical protein
MNYAEFVWIGSFVIVVSLLALVLALDAKIGHLEREIDLCRGMIAGSVGVDRVYSDRISECKDTVADYKDMLDTCEQSNNRCVCGGDGFTDDIKIVPIPPFVMKNFTWDNDLPQPILKRINTTVEPIILMGSCNDTDPLSPCL